jgi:hypothetical protein
MKAILFIAALAICSTLHAQDTGRMETDRPDQTESPYITKKGWFQAEAGFNLENDRSGFKTLVHPTVLSKYGVCRWFEFRLITEFVSEERPSEYFADETVFDRGLKPIQVGGKLRLFEEKGWLPKTSLIFHTSIPKAASKKFQETKWAPDFRFTFQHTLSQTVSLGYNLGAEWDGEEEGATWIYTLAPGFNIGKNWYAYIEAFGYLNADNHPQHAVDGGVAYYISDNAKIDLSAGAGITPNTNLKNYVALGFSFRLPIQ